MSRLPRLARGFAPFAVALFAVAGCAGEAPRETAAATTDANAPVPAQAAPSTTPAKPSSEDERTIYALGVGLSRQLAPLHLSESEVALLAKGLADGTAGRASTVDPESFRTKIEQLTDRRSQAAAAGERTAGAAFLKKAAAEPGARTLPSGMVMTTLRPGTGISPILSQSVQVRYKGTLANGTVFDSSEGEAEPATVPLGRMIPCWAQAVQLMKEGEKAKLVCPPDLAYGDRGLAPSVPPGATLIFEVELVRVVHGP